MNEAVGMKNRLIVSGLKKRLRLVSPFRRQEFWECIGCILSAVTYRKKLHKICSEIPKTVGQKPQNKLHRDVCGNTYIHKLCCDIYRPFYIYYLHFIVLSYTTLFIYWMFI